MQNNVLTLLDKIDAILPQTQCTKCGFSGCRPYAEAIANEEALYNQCPPGGTAGILKIAQLLNKPVLPLNADNGIEKPRTVAIIDEDACIGCTLCIAACPVDAIIGAPKQMHAVITDFCTGCDLCISPCPVDCITMENIAGDKIASDTWSVSQAETARNHYYFKRARLEKEQAARDARLAAKT